MLCATPAYHRFKDHQVGWRIRYLSIEIHIRSVLRTFLEPLISALAFGFTMGPKAGNLYMIWDPSKS
jgi:hypothetical protein